MSFTEKRLLGPTQLTTSASSALYTVPSGKSTIIKQIVVTNTTSTSATFTLYLNTATAANALFSATQVAGNDSVVINLSQVMSSGETIRALASANTTLNITVSGVENDGPLNPLSSYIADGAITTAKIATGAVVTEDLASNAVTQAKLASNLSGVTVTTSALRATAIPSPFEGQMCYETDTDKVLVWNGSAWYPNWNQAWGIIALTTNSTAANSSTSETATLTTSSFTAVSNRYYKITYFEPNVQIPGGAGSYMAMRIRLTNTSGTLLQYTQQQASGATQVANGMLCSSITTLPAGATVVLGSLQSSAGTPGIFRGGGATASLLVEDIGPA